MIKKKTSKLEVEPILDPKETVKQHKKILGKQGASRGRLSRKRMVDKYPLTVPRTDALGREIGKVSIVRELNRRLNDNRTIVDRIIKAWVKECEAGNIQAIQEMLNRLDGKVAEVHKIDSENPVTLIFAPALQLATREPEPVRDSYINITDCVGGVDSERRSSIEPDEIIVRELLPPTI